MVATVLLSGRPAVRQSVDPLPILDRAGAAYEAAHTLAADFVQVVNNPLLGAPDTTRGKLFQKPPSYFEMRFTVPQGDRIVADGRHLWLYTPSTTPGQVIRSAIPAVGTRGPNLIGQFVDHARERYQARYVRSDTLSPDDVADVIALVPKASDLPYRSAVIWVGRGDALVRRLEIAETANSRLRCRGACRWWISSERRGDPCGGRRIHAARPCEVECRPPQGAVQQPVVPGQRLDVAPQGRLVAPRDGPRQRRRRVSPHEVLERAFD